MKTINFYIVISFFIITIYGCGYSYYYQVQEISKTSNTNNSKNENEFKFNNNDLIIDYDFWSSNGYSDMKIYNSTDSIIILNMELSHFAVNSHAYSYFNNEVKTQTNTITTNTFSSNLNTRISNNKSTIQVESKTIVLPPKTYKLISGFDISKVYTDCELKRFKDSSSVLFNLNSTPFSFSNIIYYSKGIDNKNHIEFKNDFWISKVTNIIEDKFITMDYEYSCGKPISIYKTTKYYKLKSANRFYIKYANTP
jgi:hypothetical protein